MIDAMEPCPDCGSAKHKSCNGRPSKSRLQAMCRRLALAQIRTCKTLHQCVFCAQPIRYGDQYRDRGHDARAHVICFEAVNREVNR